jgi:hypothetical protein
LGDILLSYTSQVAGYKGPAGYGRSVPLRVIREAGSPVIPECHEHPGETS